MQITSKSRVDEVLRQVPQASHQFVALHTDCVGCHLARFCTLEDVSVHYHLDLQALVAALQPGAPPIPSRSRGVAAGKPI